MPARLEFACGHAALVSLASVKGESPRQRTERVEREKAAAQQRTCDFCARSVALETIDGATSAADCAPSHLHPAAGHQPIQALEDRITNRQGTSDQEDLMTTTPRNSPLIDEAASTRDPNIAESTEPSDTGPKRVSRRLSEDQESEVTRLYAETPSPLANIARRFGIGQTSVSRIAQRHGATLRTPSLTRSSANRTLVPSDAALGSSNTADAEVSPTEPQATARPTPGGVPRPDETLTRRRRSGVKHAAPTRATARKGSGAAGLRPATGTVSGTQRRFRITFVAERVVKARTILDALHQAEARGTTAVTSITRVD
ncbi:MAG: hypothetical protein M3069_33160 [Chloroflexota bacterium]|nr:hypothetical protein [Chloroflexota bacterium]